LLSFYPHGSCGIENGEHHNAHVREDGKPHPGKAQRAENEADELDKKGDGNIAMCLPYSSSCRKFNVNTPTPARQITDKVFWDVK
jgi:hypothetical protein